jgi:hypothetical protein
LALDVVKLADLIDLILSIIENLTRLLRKPSFSICTPLEGYLRSPSNKLLPIQTMSNWVSPQLGIRFDWQPKRELIIYDPKGDRFLNTLEIDAENRRLTDRAERAESKLEEGARRLIAAGMPIAQIAEVLNLSIEELRGLE